MGRRRQRDGERLQRLLREMRVEAGLKQTELAGRVDRPQSFVSKYETGERRLDILELRDLCRACGTSLSAFARKLDRLLPAAVAAEQRAPYQLRRGRSGRRAPRKKNAPRARRRGRSR